MKLRKPAIAAVATAAACAAAFGIQTLNAQQQPAFKRVELQKQDLSTPGREVVQARVEFDPGAGIGRHTHPGEEVTYVMEGTLLLEIDGQPARTLQAGEVFFIPAGVIHAGRNSGSTPGKVLATYIVEKGKPLATLIK